MNTVWLVGGILLDLVCLPINKWVLPCWDHFTGANERWDQEQEQIRRELWTDGTFTPDRPAAPTQR